MNYYISGETFSNPLLKELLQTLSLYFENKGLPFYVIGATARDIIMRQLLNQESKRHTKDLDIAIAISDWNLFEEISEDIALMDHFEKSRHQKQRFLFYGIYELDIIPFGKIARKDDHIYWPPDEAIAMSVKGFDAALKNVITIRVDDEFDIRVTSLSGLFLLKLNAWNDRSLSTSKDAEDLCYLIENYYDAFEERNTERDYHQEIYDMADFDTFVAGATWLGYDIAAVLTKEQAEYYNSVLITELLKEEDSRLLEQMMKQSHIITYKVLYRALSVISSILQQRSYMTN